MITPLLENNPLLAESIDVCLRHGFQVLTPGGEEWRYRERGRKRHLQRPWRREFLETLLRLHGHVRWTLKALKLSSNLPYTERKREPWFDKAMRMARGKASWDDGEWKAALDIADWMEASVPTEKTGEDGELIRKKRRGLEAASSEKGLENRPPAPAPQVAEALPQKISRSLHEKALRMAIALESHDKLCAARRRRNQQNDRRCARPQAERPPPPS